MRSLRLFLALAVLALAAGKAHSDDPLGAIGSLASGNSTGQVLGDLGKIPTPGTTGSFGRGLGQVVRGWTHDGVKGTELAERIHWLQQTRAADRGDFSLVPRPRRFLAPRPRRSLVPRPRGAAPRHPRGPPRDSQRPEPHQERRNAAGPRPRGAAPRPSRLPSRQGQRQLARPGRGP